jgi:hypothetical protein
MRLSSYIPFFLIGTLALTAPVRFSDPYLHAQRLYLTFAGTGLQAGPASDLNVVSCWRETSCSKFGCFLTKVFHLAWWFSEAEL